MNKLYIYVILINFITLVILRLGFIFRPNRKGVTLKVLAFFLWSTIVLVGLFYALNEIISIQLYSYLYYIVLPAFIIHFVFCFKNIGQLSTTETREAAIRQLNPFFTRDVSNSLEFSTKQGLIEINNFFTHFLVVAGTRSGKTKSIGIPLLKQYLINGFCGMVYDAKEFDYTKVVYYFKHILKLPISVYHMNFRDMKHTYRCNILKPEVLKQYNFLAEVLRDICIGLSEKNSKQDEWFNAGLGVVQGVAVRFFFDFPQYCSTPHIALFVSLKTPEEILEFVKARTESRIYADELIKSQASEKTMASILWSASQVLKPLSSNKNICFVLGGDDFDFNLIEPNNPKIICISNDQKNGSVLNGLIGSMVNVLSKHIDFGNTQPTMFFMDEGTTFRIPNFSQLVGLLAEYKVSFAFLTQSISKITEVYQDVQRTSIVANFNNKFLGRTNVPNDAKEYSLIFGQTKETKITKNVGSSSNNKSSSTSKGQSESEIDKDIFTPDHFMNQMQGEFTGVFLDSNYKKGVFNYNMLDIDEEVIQNVMQEVSQNGETEVEEFYKKVIRINESLK